jgi:hypothetical protein
MPPGERFGVVVAENLSGVLGAAHQVPELRGLANLQMDDAGCPLEAAFDYFPVQAQAQQLVKQFFRCHAPQPTRHSTENSEDP